MDSLLVEKYRPETLEGIILDDNIKKMLKDKIKHNTMDNILLCGKKGIGKSSLAKLIVNELDADFLYINAGFDNSIDTIRNKIKEFCDSVAMNSEVPKIVILDEAHAIRMDGQIGLNNIMEMSASDTRFILTANYINKILDTIQSRCTPVNISHKISDVLKRIIFILDNEKIKYTKEILSHFTNTIIKKKYPDIRGIINNLSLMIVDGKLTKHDINENIQEIEEVADIILEMDNSKKSREYWIQNEDKFGSNYEELAHCIFNKLDSGKQQLIVADYLYKMAIVLDKEIQFYAMYIELRNMK
jgi:replication factor C small subunit